MHCNIFYKGLLFTVIDATSHVCTFVHVLQVCCMSLYVCATCDCCVCECSRVHEVVLLLNDRSRT